MIEKIYNYGENTLGVLSKSPVSIGDTFFDGYNSTTKEKIKKSVETIIEQRPEKGEYKDDSNRKIWSKVTVSILNNQIK